MLLQQESSYSTVEWNFKEKLCKDNSFYEILDFPFPALLTFLPCLANAPYTGMVSELLLAISEL